MPGPDDEAPLLVHHEAGVAWLTLNRPAKLNSLTLPLFGLLQEAIDAAATDSSVRCVVLAAAGRGFCAGQDLGERTGHPGGEIDLAGSLDQRYNPLVRAIRALPKPVVAAVNGVAAGAGCSIALSADIVIAARSARFIQAFAGIGLVPDSGATWLLPRLVGLPRATAMAMLAEPVDGLTAALWGLVWRCVEDGDLEHEVKGLAGRLATGPTRALALMKQAFAASATNSYAAQLDLERDLQGEAGATADYAAGVAAFHAKRRPDFTGT